MHAAVVIFTGPGHVVAYQSHSAILLLGLIIGIPAREAICHPRGAFNPLLMLLDDVYATSQDLRVEVAGGTIWLTRLESGVGLYYERSLERSMPSPRREHQRLVSAR